MTTKILPVQSSRGTSAALRSAELLRQVITAEPPDFDELTPYYVAAVCAAIEGAINNCYVEFFHRKFGKGAGKYVKPFLFMKVQERLTLAPLLLSNFRYELNGKSERAKKVFALFDLRNQFIHVKDLWHYADVEFDDDGGILKYEFHDRNHPDPYRSKPGGTLLSNIDVAAIETLRKAFMNRFGSLPNAIARKTFKPDEWVVRAERI